MNVTRDLARILAASRAAADEIDSAKHGSFRDLTAARSRARQFLTAPNWKLLPRELQVKVMAHYKRAMREACE